MASRTCASGRSKRAHVGAAYWPSRQQVDPRRTTPFRVGALRALIRPPHHGHHCRLVDPPRLVAPVPTDRTSHIAAPMCPPCGGHARSPCSSATNASEWHFSFRRAPLPREPPLRNAHDGNDDEEQPTKIMASSPNGNSILRLHVRAPLVTPASHLRQQPDFYGPDPLAFAAVGSMLS